MLTMSLKHHCRPKPELGHETGCVLALPFKYLDGDSFMDRSVYGHLCVNHGSRWQLDGRYFDGVGNYVEVLHHSSIDVSSGKSLTLDVWIYPKTLAVNQRITVKRVNGAKGYMLMLAGATLQFVTDNIDSTGGDISATTVLPSANAWYHPVGTYNGSTQKLCVNGELKDTKSQSGDFSNSTNLNLGRHSVVGQYFNGLLGEVSFYNFADYIPRILSRSIGG